MLILKFKKKKTKSSVINNDTYQKETLSERPIRQPLTLEFNIRRFNLWNLTFDDLTFGINIRQFNFGIFNVEL